MAKREIFPVPIEVVMESPMLGLSRGSLTTLDGALKRLSKEAAARWCVALLNALAADRRQNFRNVNRLYASTLPSDLSNRLERVLRPGDALFLEPLQQLVVLRRALAVCPKDGDVELVSDEGSRCYFDACRSAADIIPSPPFRKDINGTAACLRIAAGTMNRFWISHPVNPLYSIGRSVELFETQRSDAAVNEAVERLKAGLERGLNLPWTEATTLIRILAVAQLQFKLQDIIARPASVSFTPETLAAQLTISPELIARFLTRAARELDDPLDDSLPGGTTGLIPFRDRPLLRFADGSFAPIYPELLLEKLTPSMFWWSTEPGQRQRHHWKADWGKVAESYATMVLERIAASTGCTFRGDIGEPGRWQLDGAMWSPDRRTAVFEVTAGGLTDAAAASADPEQLRQGLHRLCVDSGTRDKPRAEGVLQLARDVRLFVGGKLQEKGLPNPTRVHPVLLTFDRRFQAPGSWLYLDDELTKALPDSVQWPIAPLAVLTIEELEGVEALALAGRLKGEPPGLLKMLRMWEARSRKVEAWWAFLSRDWPTTPENERLEAAATRWLLSVRHVWTDGDSPNFALGTNLRSPVPLFPPNCGGHVK
jgi:hypothetical protein